ncbi:hypothetical protein K4K49_005751 [Colletotrichum sp. SAR 10_70]|nr:hypothetical protein K4K50_013258 [Colletotrichum sp. SAR 10_71]KAI8165785.1 hypothetical protein K4K49_005751 [Colletotrichum sp. SAR 10_70]
MQSRLTSSSPATLYTRLIKDLQLGYTARILESLWGTVAASWALLADTSVPASPSIAGEGDRSRNESTDRIARVVLSAVSSFEEEPVKSADPTTRLLEYLDAARHIEQQIPTLPREDSHPPGHVRSHAGSHISFSGAVHLETTARHIHVPLHVEHHFVTIARLHGLDDDILETIETLIDFLSKFHQGEPAIVVSQDGGAAWKTSPPTSRSMTMGARATGLGRGF